MAAANRFLAEQFLPAFNPRFTVPAEEPGTAFVSSGLGRGSPISSVSRKNGLCKENTVHYREIRLQIPQDRYRFHYVKGMVLVHEYPEGTLAVFHGPRCLARYHADRRLIESDTSPPSRRGPTQGSGERAIVDPRPTGRQLNNLKEAHRTDHALHIPDKLTCYLHSVKSRGGGTEEDTPAPWIVRERRPPNSDIDSSTTVEGNWVYASVKSNRGAREGAMQNKPPRIPYPK